MQTYKIVRFHKNQYSKVIARGLSLEEAQRHCKNPNTRKQDKDGHVIWFDGYTAEGVN